MRLNTQNCGKHAMQHSERATIEACISTRAERNRPAGQEVEQMEYASIQQEGEKRNQILCEDLQRMSTAHCRGEGRKTTLLLVSDALFGVDLS